MRIVFMGSGAFACPAVEALAGAAGLELVAAVTQPDRPRGRRLQLAPCAVKALAQRLGVPVLDPERIADPAAQAAIAALRPDVAVVADYGQYLPRAVLALPRLATINIHPSLLPRHRGAAPIPWALALGDAATGVTILHVSPRMDAGDIILQEAFPIGPDDTTATLEPRLAAEGARLAVAAVGLLAEGRAPRIPQDESRVTLAPKLGKEDGRVDWSRPAEEIRNRVRAFDPWPGSFFTHEGRRVKLLACAVAAGEATTPAEPGAAVSVRGELTVATGRAWLRLDRVQPEGRLPVRGADFANGARLQVGARLA